MVLARSIGPILVLSILNLYICKIPKIHWPINAHLHCHGMKFVKSWSPRIIINMGALWYSSSHSIPKIEWFYLLIVHSETAKYFYQYVCFEIIFRQCSPNSYKHPLNHTNSVVTQCAVLKMSIFNIYLKLFVGSILHMNRNLKLHWIIQSLLTMDYRTSLAADNNNLCLGSSFVQVCSDQEIIQIFSSGQFR